MSLHIGYLVQQFPPEVGAGPARVMEMSRRWLERGARVTVFTGMPNRPEGRIHAPYRGRMFVAEEWEGVTARRSWLYASPEPGFARTLLNNLTFMAASALTGVMRGGGLDVLIASSPPFFPHISGVAVSALRQIPLVLEVRDLWPDYLLGMGVVKEGSASARGLLDLEAWLLGRADAVTVVTDSFRTRIIEKGVEERRVEVLPNGVDTTFYRRDVDAPPPLPSLEPAPGELRVGYLGNFGAGQGLDVVLDAACILQERHPLVRFVLAGDGPDRMRLQERLRAPDAPANVFVHPPIPKERTRDFYNCCDVVLVPLAPIPVFQETIPSKLFEILACERPVVASLDGEGRRIVEGSGGGWAVPPGNAPALAAGILQALDTPEPERLRMGRLGRDYVSRVYDRGAIADRYLSLLERVAGRRVVWNGDPVNRW